MDVATRAPLIGDGMRASAPRRGVSLRVCFAIYFVASSVFVSSASAQKDCKKPLYLTFDTGHMAVAPLVADVLARQQVRVTFFAANERTQEGDGSLGNHPGLGFGIGNPLDGSSLPLLVESRVSELRRRVFKIFVCFIN